VALGNPESLLSLTLRPWAFTLPLQPVHLDKCVTMIIKLRVSKNALWRAEKYV
jgi:hypothetical protein